MLACASSSSRDAPARSRASTTVRTSRAVTVIPRDGAGTPLQVYGAGYPRERAGSVAGAATPWPLVPPASLLQQARTQGGDLVNIRIACTAGMLGAAGCGSAPTGSSPYNYSNPSSADAASSVASPPPALPATGDVPSGSSAAGSEPDGAGGGGDASSGSATDDAAGTACVTGQVTPDQVVVLGDSYLDPVWANTALDIYADAQDAGSLAANTTYRHYDI